MQKSIFFYFIIVIILIFISNILSLNGFSIDISNNSEFTKSNFHYNSNSIYTWPVFGYYSISSYFGKRTSPTSGASTFHSGIDIPAPTGTNIYSISSRKSNFYRLLWSRSDIQLLLKRTIFKSYMDMFHLNLL